MKPVRLEENLSTYQLRVEESNNDEESCAPGSNSAFSHPLCTSAQNTCSFPELLIFLMPGSRAKTQNCQDPLVTSNRDARPSQSSKSHKRFLPKNARDIPKGFFEGTVDGNDHVIMPNYLLEAYQYGCGACRKKIELQAYKQLNGVGSHTNLPDANAANSYILY